MKVRYPIPDPRSQTPVIITGVDCALCLTNSQLPNLESNPRWYYFFEFWVRILSFRKKYAFVTLLTLISNIHFLHLRGGDIDNPPDPYSWGDSIKQRLLSGDLRALQSQHPLTSSPTNKIHNNRHSCLLYFWETSTCITIVWFAPAIAMALSQLLQLLVLIKLMYSSAFTSTFTHQRKQGRCLDKISQLFMGRSFKPTDPYAVKVRSKKVSKYNMPGYSKGDLENLKIVFKLFLHTEAQIPSMSFDSFLTSKYLRYWPGE